MGKVGKGIACSVQACKDKAERSLSKEEVAGTGLSISSESRRVYLCHGHYKVWKKTARKEKSLERARWGV